MNFNRCALALAAVASLASASFAQTTAGEGAPLSAIDWLTEPPSEPAQGVIPIETPVVSSAALPSVDALPLDDGSGGGKGLISPNVSGLPARLWRGTTLEELRTLMAALPAEALAPVADLRARLLLATAEPPSGATDQDLLLWRVQTLRALGDAPAAVAMIEDALASISSDLFAEYADLTLVMAEADRACDVLRTEPALSSDLSLSVFCFARGSDWAAAALVLRTGEALGEISPERASLLTAFLDPELADGGVPAMRAADVSPLDHRLREAIGEPLATIDLPRVFAHSDLRPEMGWKAQIDAAERLTRTNALPATQLFAYYTARTPAASGSVWDRAKAVQALDRALESGTPLAVGATLPSAWRTMDNAGLLPALAEMVADRLDPAQSLASRPAAYRDALLLLSQRYEDIGDGAPALMRAFAFGDPAGVEATSPLTDALLAGFSTAKPVERGALGARILTALAGIEAARQGDLTRLPTSIATLRSVGLESSARQSALHLTILNQ